MLLGVVNHCTARVEEKIPQRGGGKDIDRG